MNRYLRNAAFVLLLLGACGNVSTDIPSEPPSIQDLEKQLADNLPEGLPPLSGNVTEEAKEALREKCKRLGGPGAYEKLEISRDDFQACVMSLVNVTVLQEEIEKAKPEGNVDRVFRDYCRKSPQFTECINNFTSTIEPCLEEREKESKKIVLNITEALLGFACHKEGDRIALFIAEGGPECFQEKQEKITQCANATISKYMPAQEAGANLPFAIPMLVLEEKECRSIQMFQHCAVTALEECSEPTPANIVESLFQFIFKMTPCHKMNLKAERKSSSASSWSKSSLYFTITMLLVRGIVA